MDDFFYRLSGRVRALRTWIIKFLAEQGVGGVPRGGTAVRRPLGVVATATPSSNSNSKRLDCLS